ncbi:hypothetical protein ES708_24723 [subsurface metagenome]
MDVEGKYIKENEVNNWPADVTEEGRQEIINEVEARAEQITHDYFYPKTFHEFLDGNGRDRLFLPIRQKILSINYMAISRVEVSTIDKTGTDIIIPPNLFIGVKAVDNKAFTDGIGNWVALAGGTLTSEVGGETGNGGKYIAGDPYSMSLLKLDDDDGKVLTNLVPGSKYRITLYAKMGAWTGGIVTIKCDGQSKELPDLTEEFVLTVFDFTANGTDATITIDCATAPTGTNNELWIDTLEFVQYTGIAGGYTVTLTISATADYYKGNYLGIKDASERINNLWGSRILGNTATDEDGKSVFTLGQPLKMALEAADVVSIITNWDFDDDCIYRSPLGITHEPGALMEPSEFFLNGYFPKGQRNIEIKGTIGHYTCPQAIKNACIILARDENDPSLYEHYEFEKESMGGYIPMIEAMRNIYQE